MRHLGSVLLSLLFAPLIWLSTGVGVSKLAEGLTEDPDRFAAFTGLLAIGIAGLLYSLLVLSRLSPLGPVLVGLGFAGATLWALMARGSFRDTVPEHFLGVAGAGWLPSTGYAALLAVPLLATIFSPRRWRRYADQSDAGSHPTLYGSDETRRTGGYSGYGSSGYGSSSYDSSYDSSSYGSSSYDSSSYGSYGSPQYGSSTSPPLSTYHGYGEESDDTRPLRPDR